MDIRNFGRAHKCSGWFGLFNKHSRQITADKRSLCRLDFDSCSCNSIRPYIALHKEKIFLLVICMADKNLLEIKNVSKQFKLANGNEIFALKNVNFSVKNGEFVSVIGPSGCGKSTLIKMLAGLTEPTNGQIIENNKNLDKNSEDRGIIFQNYNLFPWLSVEKNIGFGLNLRKVDEKLKNKIVSHYIEIVGLRGFEKAYPKELSGGMQQRVALARTLVTNPKIMLLDEPFAALDVQTRRFMQDLLLQIWSSEKQRTIIFVTHDVEEAVFMSDKVYVLSAGPGTIKEKLDINLPRPRNLKTEFSADFIKKKENWKKMITKESLKLEKLNLDIYKDLK